MAQEILNAGSVDQTNAIWTGPENIIGQYNATKDPAYVETDGAGDYSGDHLRIFEDEHSDGGHAHRLARAVGHIGWPPEGGSYGTRRPGRPVHPNWGLPGGVSCGIDEEKRAEIEKLGRDAIALCDAIAKSGASGQFVKVKKFK